MQTKAYMLNICRLFDIFSLNKRLLS